MKSCHNIGKMIILILNLFISENIALPQRMPDPFYRKLIWLMRELFKELNRLTNDGK